jgi:hypothetical protein
MAEALVFFNAKVVHVFQSVSMSNDYIGPVRLSYKPYFFNEQCFSLTINQRIILLAMTFQPSE